MVAKAKKSGSGKRSEGSAAVAGAGDTAVRATAEAVSPTVEAPTVEAPTVEAPAVEAPAVEAAETPAAASKPRRAAQPVAGDLDLAFGRDNVAAMVRANAALVRGFEEMGQEVAGFTRRNMTAAVDAARALVGVRTVADLVAINRSLAQSTLEGVIANSARLSEIGIRVATEAFGPLNDQLATTFGTFGRPAQ
jgi:hypothetical protein